MSQHRSLLDLPTETRIRIYDFVEPWQLEWDKPHQHLTLMAEPKPSFLALLCTCKLIHTELLQHLFSTRIIFNFCNPESFRAFQNLHPAAKGHIKMIQATRPGIGQDDLFHGFIDLAPIWTSLRTECHSLSILSLVFGGGSETEGVRTLLDLAVHLSESAGKDTDNIKLRLRCRPGLPANRGYGRRNLLEEMQRDAIKRYTINRMSSLPLAVGCIFVDIRNPVHLPRLVNAITTLNFAGRRGFVKSQHPESDGWWMWTFQPIEDVAEHQNPDIGSGFDPDPYTGLAMMDEDGPIAEGTYPNLHPTSRSS